MILIPLFNFWLYPQINKLFNFTPLYKVFTGMIFCALSFFIISSIETRIHSGETVHVYWQILAYLVLTIGEVLVSLTALEYSYTQSPVSLKSIVMGLYLFSVSLGNFTTSMVNKNIVENLNVNHLSVDNEMLTISSDMVLETGDKINIDQNLGILHEKNEDGKIKTDTLSGTFLVERLEKVSYRVWDYNRNPIKVSKSSNFETKQSNLSTAFSKYKINGSQYFNFFAYLMLITSVLFLPFAMKLKDKTYMQEG
jgi:POT family proton-dependent oligopeptide transporter